MDALHCYDGECENDGGRKESQTVRQDRGHRLNDEGYSQVCRAPQDPEREKGRRHPRHGGFDDTTDIDPTRHGVSVAAGQT